MPELFYGLYLMVTILTGKGAGVDLQPLNHNRMTLQQCNQTLKDLEYVIHRRGRVIAKVVCLPRFITTPKRKVK